jgi:hypothetical protein
MTSSPAGNTRLAGSKARVEELGTPRSPATPGNTRLAGQTARAVFPAAIVRDGSNLANPGSPGPKREVS